MSIILNNSLAQYAQAASGINLGSSFAIGAWVRSTGQWTGYTILSGSDVSLNAKIGDASIGVDGWVKDRIGGWHNAVTYNADALDSSVWHYLLFAVNSAAANMATGVLMSMDGVDYTFGTQVIGTADWSQGLITRDGQGNAIAQTFALGRNISGGSNSYWVGGIRHLAVWAGYIPTLTERQNIAARALHPRNTATAPAIFKDLLGSINDPDDVGGGAWTAFNTPTWGTGEPNMPTLTVGAIRRWKRQTSLPNGQQRKVIIYARSVAAAAGPIDTSARIAGCPGTGLDGVVVNGELVIDHPSRIEVDGEEHFADVKQTTYAQNFNTNTTDIADGMCTVVAVTE